MKDQDKYFEEKIKNTLYNFLVKIEEGRKKQVAMDSDAYLIDMFSKHMAIDILLEIRLRAKFLKDQPEQDEKPICKHCRHYHEEMCYCGCEEK